MTFIYWDLFLKLKENKIHILFSRLFFVFCHHSFVSPLWFCTTFVWDLFIPMWNTRHNVRDVTKIFHTIPTGMDYFYTRINYIWNSGRENHWLWKTESMLFCQNFEPCIRIFISRAALVHLTLYVMGVYFVGKMLLLKVECDSGTESHVYLCDLWRVYFGINQIEVEKIVFLCWSCSLCPSFGSLSISTQYRK